MSFLVSLKYTATTLAPGIHVHIPTCKGGQLSPNQMVRAVNAAHVNPLQPGSWMRSPDGKSFKKPLAYI